MASVGCQRFGYLSYHRTCPPVDNPLVVRVSGLVQRAGDKVEGASGPEGGKVGIVSPCPPARAGDAGFEANSGDPNWVGVLRVADADATGATSWA